MILNDEQQQELARVEGAGAQLVAAKENVRESVFDALEAGVPLRRVAEAAGIGHATVYRWLDESDAA